MSTVHNLAFGIPRVTEILKPLYSSFAMDEEAAKRGTMMHKLIANYDSGATGLLVGDSISTEARRIIMGWTECIDKLAFSTIEIESEVVNSDCGYYGHPDRIGHIDGTLTILDAKFGANQPVYALQLAAYVMAKLNTPYPTEQCYKAKRGTIIIGPDGSAKCHWHTKRTDFAAFLSMLNLHRWAKENKVTIGG